MTLEEIAEVAETEGLAYALTDGGYLKPEDFDDPELARAAEAAQTGLRKLNDALEDYLP
jgi:hypothetical protein